MATAAKTTPFPAFPKFDADMFVAAQKRNAEAFQAAGKIVLDASQAIMQRQAEIAEANLKTMVADGEALMKAKPGELKMDSYLGKAKAAFEKSVSETKEVADIAAKAQGEAFAVLNQCASANLDDLKKISV